MTTIIQHYLFKYIWQRMESNMLALSAVTVYQESIWYLNKNLKKKPRGTFDESTCQVNGIDVAMVSWMVNKVVNLMSTFVGSQPVEKNSRYARKTNTREQIDCPKIVKCYNQHMGGVDWKDSHFGRHKISMKSKKWYFRIFYHLVDMTVINTWIVQNKVLEIKKKPKDMVTLGDFREMLAETLC